LPLKYHDWAFIVAFPADGVPDSSGTTEVSDDFSKKLAKSPKIVI
jgi:hypothetical protein